MMKESGPISGPADGKDMYGGAGVVWLISCIVSLIIAASILKIFFGCVMTAEFISGWALASGNALVAIVINMTAMRKRRQDFIVWGAGGFVLRILAVLVIILLVKLLGGIRFEPFISVFLASYFVFMISETVRMNVVNLRNM